MFKKLMVGVVAGLLLVGTSEVKAQNVFEDIWVIAGVQSASGEVEKEFEEQLLGPDDVCVQGAQTIRGMGFSLKLIVELEPRLTAILYQKSGDTAALLCGLVELDL